MRPERQIRGKVKVVFQAGHSMANGQSLGGEGEAGVARLHGPTAQSFAPFSLSTQDAREQGGPPSGTGSAAAAKSTGREHEETDYGEKGQRDSTRRESTGREYGEKVPGKSTVREYQERVPGESTRREYRERVWGESTRTEYQERV